MATKKLHLLTHKSIITLVLLLIGALHTMVFTFFQLPDSYATTIPYPYLVYLKLISYTAAIITSIFYQSFTRSLGIKKVFLIGLTLNFIGLCFILLSWLQYQTVFYMYLFIFLACLSFGLALLTVINSLITYLIIEYPSWINTGIIVLFIFFNLGVMLAPLLLEFFKHYDAKWVFIFVLMGLLLFSIASAKKLFVSPQFPKHLKELKKSTSLWKDLHYRLAFFVLAIVFYGIVENTISLWGEIYLTNFFIHKEANTMMSLFWLFMIIGLVLVLPPLYYFKLKTVFSALCLIVFGSLWGLYLSTDPYTLTLFIILGGIGCSAIFPIIIATLSSQIVKDSKTVHASFLPYIEMGCSTTLAGYIFGVGLVDFFHVWDYKEEFIRLPDHFFYATWALLGTLIIYLFLHMYDKVKKLK